MTVPGNVAWIAGTGTRSGIGAALAHELAHRGARVGVTDSREPVALRSAVEEAETQLGPIDVAVVDAGMREHVEANLTGMVNSLDAILPRMIERRSGTIVGVASSAAESNLLESLRTDLEPLGVDVQIVNPAFVRTPPTDANDFPMPFTIEAPDAARRIADAIEAGKALSQT